ncbi:CoA-binding protein [soil metagenome]
MSPMDLCALLGSTKRIAVLGIKTDAAAGQPAHDVPKYLVEAGFDVVPVPVYYPEATEIFGRKVYRKLVDVPGDVDLVNVFRRRVDLDAHLDDIVAKKPKVVWLQLGIKSEPFAKKLTEAGIIVVMDKCIMVEHRRCT